MAELSEVEQTLVCLIAQAVYPLGTAAPSVIDSPVRVYRGWPIPQSFDADLKNGVAHVSVFPLDVEQNVTKYPTEWMELPLPPVTLTLTAANQSVTVGGRVGSPLNAAIVADNRAYVYPVQAADTLTSIATALSALIPGSSSSGPVITLPGAKKIAARVGQIGGLISEIKRQKRSFRVTIWCATPQARDGLAAAIDPALSSLSFIALPDGSHGRIRYERSPVTDAPQKTMLYRRDFSYSVEYATTLAQGAATVVTEQLGISGGLDPSDPVVETVNI